MEYKNFPRVLVISHNAFSTTSNMGKTLASFFYGWEKTEIAQMYFHMEFPNSDVCDNFFRVTDFDILKSIIKFQEPGEVLSKNDIKLDTPSNNMDKGIQTNIYKIGKEKKPYMYFLRNLIWNNKKWETKKLIEWLDDFSPEIVFFAAGDYSFSMKVARTICKSRDIPLVVFFGDDYYVNPIHKGYLNFLNNIIFKKEYLRLFSYLSSYIAASDKMLKTYTEVFQKMGHSIMTPTEIANQKNDLKVNELINISYLGNLGGGRWKALIEIGQCLKKMGLLLNVYSGENRKEIISELNEENGIVFMGAIPAYRVKEVIQESTIIVHVESMNPIDKERTQYSMSTKIAESLGSGVCLFAYGPKDVSSIEYLMENDAAYVVTEKSDLGNALIDIISSDELRRKYINNAVNLASNRHNFERNTELILGILQTTSGKGK